MNGACQDYDKVGCGRLWFQQSVWTVCMQRLVSIATDRNGPVGLCDDRKADFNDLLTSGSRM